MAMLENSFLFWPRLSATSSACMHLHDRHQRQVSHAPNFLDRQNPQKIRNVLISKGAFCYHSLFLCFSCALLKCFHYFDQVTNNLLFTTKRWYFITLPKSPLFCCRSVSFEWYRGLSKLGLLWEGHCDVEPSKILACLGRSFLLNCKWKVVFKDLYWILISRLPKMQVESSS